MPVFLIILILPFLIIGWLFRFLFYLQSRKTEARMLEAIAKAKRDALNARPLKDYVAGLEPRKVQKISLGAHPVSPSAPTLGNIGRFAALSIRSHADEYFVRDEEGTVYGPADEATVLQWIQEGRITVETPMSSHAEGPWLPARKIRALQPAFHIVDTSISLGRFDHIQIK